MVSYLRSGGHVARPSRKKNTMSLLKRPLLDVDWPSLLGRSAFDWPDTWPDMLVDSTVRVEEFERDGSYVIRAEVPGIDPDKDVELTMNDSTLRLMVHRQQEKHASEFRHYRSEFRYGSFTRMVSLPAGATAKEIHANYADGILEVTVPMNGSKAKEQRIPIEHR